MKITGGARYASTYSTSRAPMRVATCSASGTMGYVCILPSWCTSAGQLDQEVALAKPQDRTSACASYNPCQHVHPCVQVHASCDESLQAIAVSTVPSLVRALPTGATAAAVPCHADGAATVWPTQCCAFAEWLVMPLEEPSATLHAGACGLLPWPPWAALQLPAAPRPAPAPAGVCAPAPHAGARVPRSLRRPAR